MFVAKLVAFSNTPFELPNVLFEDPLYTFCPRAFRLFRGSLEGFTQVSVARVSTKSRPRVSSLEPWRMQTSFGAHQPHGPCLRLTRGVSLTAVDSKASDSVDDSSSTLRVAPGGRGASVHVISLWRSAQRPWSAVNRCRSVGRFPLYAFVLQFGKPALEANAGDHDVVIGVVPLLWWSPHVEYWDFLKNY